MVDVNSMGLNQNGEYLTLLGGYYNNSDKSYKVKFPDAIDKIRSTILTIKPKKDQQLQYITGGNISGRN